MGSLLNFIVNQRDGLFLLLVLLFALGLFANWLLWMLGLGRFARKGVADTSKVRFVVADFFVKIINDFRHLLALLIVLLFALALFTAMWPGISKQEVGLIKDGLQAVAAALGGLVGSIIGYYFGESTASRGRILGGEQSPKPPPAEQSKSSEQEEPITTPPKPPSIEQ